MTITNGAGSNWAIPAKHETRGMHVPSGLAREILVVLCVKLLALLLLWILFFSPSHRMHVTDGAFFEHLVEDRLTPDLEQGRGRKPHG